MKKKIILQIKKKNFYNNDLLPNYNIPFAKQKADYTNNLIIMSSPLPESITLAVKEASGAYNNQNMVKASIGPSNEVGDSVSNKYSVAQHNSFINMVGEMANSIKDLNSLSSSGSNVKDDKNKNYNQDQSQDGDNSIFINKNILPFFSIPVILKKISDQKKNENLNLLNPQKKLVYKIIKLNTKLVEFTTKIKKYNFNLNSFKGNNLDFILFIKNNLYYNLKYNLSNISYKIEKFVPVFKLYSLLNNINLFSPKRLLKPQPYIRFSYRLRYITKITKLNLPIENMNNMAPLNENTAHQIMEINGRSINYLLVKLNNLANEIEYIINIRNKFIKLINFLKNINIKSGLEVSLDEAIHNKVFETDGGSAKTLDIKTEIANKVNRANEESIIQTFCKADRELKSIQDIQGQKMVYDDLYLQITKGTGGVSSCEGLTENKIKIEKTIKSMSPLSTVRSDLTLNSSDIRWGSYLNSLKKSVKSNPVDILYFNNNLNRPIINQYLKSMSMYNMITKGTMMFYSKFIGFNLFSLTPSYSRQAMHSSKITKSVKEIGQNALSSQRYELNEITASLSNGGEMQTNKLIKNIYKFLYSSFISMYCLISKPVFIFKANKIVIQLFYYILIPKILKYKKKKNFYYLKKNEKGKTNNIFNFNKKNNVNTTPNPALTSNEVISKGNQKNQYV